jgi:hypothetical protein
MAYLRSFAVLRRPAGARDALPGDTGIGLVSAVRLVSGPRAYTSQWLATTTDSQLCVVLSERQWGLSALPSGCVRVATLAKDQQLLVTGTTKPASETFGRAGVMIIGGLAQDGVRRVTVDFQAHRPQTVTVVNNAFQLKTDDWITRITWLTRDGVRHHITYAVARGHHDNERGQ